MKTKPSKNRRPCTPLTAQAMQNLASLILSELGKADISRGIRQSGRRKLPPAGSLTVF
ncbi:MULTISPECIES: hypothetical protein [Bacteroides]|uniref:hypothetical protein n=1 Tax=Bacteroides TaxID=816 RepID=UPI001E51CB47|nr:MULTISPECIES: hypothetical protein [Bacteroides]